MRIIHRISIASTPDIQRQLSNFGIDVADTGLVSLEIDEASDTWPALEKWILRHQAVDVATTKFSKRDLDEAHWFQLMPDWHHGYPQPHEDVFGYRQATYDLTDWCQACGIGMRQKAPFQMKGEPKWGKRSILQLNWVFDEFFVTPDVWLEFFKPHSIECRPVLNTAGSELKSVVQLAIHEEMSIVTKGLATEEDACSTCGRTKYLPITRGCFPPLASTPQAAMAKTMEYFGSGASAHKNVLISHVLADALRIAKIRGASLKPVADQERVATSRASA